MSVKIVDLTRGDSFLDTIKFTHVLQDDSWVWLNTTQAANYKAGNIEKVVIVSNDIIMVTYASPINTGKVFKYTSI